MTLRGNQISVLEKTAELIDEEVKLIIAESYIRAKEVLKNNMKGLTELAELLLDKEVIFSEDLERIFGKRKADLIKEEKETSASLIAADLSTVSVSLDKKEKRSGKKVTEDEKLKAKSAKKEDVKEHMPAEKAGTKAKGKLPLVRQKKKGVE